MKIFAMTVCCVDIYVGTDKAVLGGNALNFSTQAVISGAEKVAVLGAIGNDSYGERISKYLKSRGVDTSHLHVVTGRTASSRLYHTEQNDRYELPDSWDGGVYADFRLSEEDWAFVSNFDIVTMNYYDPNLKSVLEKKKGYKLVLDYLDTRDFDFMDRAMPQTDICFISGNREMAGRMKDLSEKHGVLVVVTLGADGSLAFFKGEEYTMGAEIVERVVDTTGCGDSYQAAFTVSYYLDGDIKAAMKKGSEAAAIVLSHYGGVNEDE